MNRQALVFGSLGLLFGGLVAYWFFDTFEHRVEEKEIGFRGEARRNQFLAAERFLQKFGMEIKSLGTILELREMPEPNDVLFIPTGRYDLAKEKIDEIMKWVDSGGHLIVRARTPSRAKAKGDDELLERLGVETDTADDELFFSDEDYELIKVHVNDGIEDKQVEFNVNNWMTDMEEHEVSWQVTSDNGSHLLEYRIGNGWVTVLSDIDFLLNNKIAEHDHAAFLYTVVHIDKSDRNLWIIRNDDMPSLLSIINAKSPAVLPAFGLFLFFWLWYVTRRFGPLVKSSQPVRRSMKEHITSSGFYQWRNENRTEMFDSARLALHEQIAAVRPLWAKLDEQRLAEKLAKVSKIPVDRVLHVLQAKQVSKETDFTQLIETLSEIRKKI